MKRTSIIIACCCQLTLAAAQVTEKADVTVAFDLSQDGHRFSPTWGLDQAWVSESNLLKGINHIGRENIGIGRIAYRFSKPLVNDSALASDVISILRQRASLFNRVSSTLPLAITADQEAGTCDYFVVNKSCNVDHWAAMINSHVHWVQANTNHPVIGVSPFNEPDYWTTEEGATVNKQVQVAKTLKEQYPRMADVAMVGGNTLNNDKALAWYTTGKQYYDWGNTHQLAGSFDTYASFFQQLQKNGKVGYADEMHNVGDAMVGLEYGMKVGIWWGFDSRARGEFCDISRNGERLAYGEHRNNWTSASVYRHDDGRVKAFIGSSERQAVTTTYQFVSLDRDVYFDGYGPQRQFRMEMPGGNGYQNGQTNAERVIDITWGDDVPPTTITNGVYKLVNKATGNVASVSGENVVLQRYNGAASQRWNLALSDPRIGGDYSFYDITSAVNAKTRLNLQDFSKSNNANIMAYSRNEKPTSNEQWYLQYDGDGYYYIRCRESALYLSALSNSKDDGINIVQKTMGTSEALRNLMRWRLLPADVDYETTPPAQPQALTAQPLTAAVQLSWTPVADEDNDGYMVLRTEEGSDAWNTIARRVQQPAYTDNTGLPGHTYIYKVKAIDRAQNQSTPSATATVTVPTERALMGHWPLDESLADVSGNDRHALSAVTPGYAAGRDEGAKSLFLRSSQWLQLPVNSVATDETTIALWVKVPSAATAWQRLFDFGYDTDHYFFLTPNNGSVMRLAIKNGGSEQQLDAPKLPTGQWKHVAVTMKAGSTCIYVDGQQVASTSAITISPADVKPVINYIGRSMFNNDPYFTGYMQDLRIYNYALSSDEVQQLFDGTTAISQPQVQQSATVHTLSGVRIEQPRKGLNIVDGKVRIVR